MIILEKLKSGKKNWRRKMPKLSLIKIEITNYSYLLCPVCWKKKDDLTTYTHINCWKELSKKERVYLFVEFNPYGPKTRTGKKYITLNKNWRKISNEERNE
jgi:predicted DsbA family dithiol-disulfide isomerase